MFYCIAFNSKLGEYCFLGRKYKSSDKDDYYFSNKPSLIWRSNKVASNNLKKLIDEDVINDSCYVVELDYIELKSWLYKDNDPPTSPESVFILRHPEQKVVLCPDGSGNKDHYKAKLFSSVESLRKGRTQTIKTLQKQMVLRILPGETIKVYDVPTNFYDDMEIVELKLVIV